MSKIVWDAIEERFFESGVDHGVLYIPDGGGAYSDGVPWNGLTGVTESPSGAEATAQYADNIKYLNLVSAEQFGGTITAFTYPREFGQFDGTVESSPGVLVGQQRRKSFGLSFRTRVGNAVDEDLGYKLHLVYGCYAAPSEKAHNTINDTPEAINFSWTLTTTPVPVTGLKPAATLTIDSTKVDSGALADLELVLYGAEGVTPRLPMPDEVISMFSGTVTAVAPGIPTYDNTTHTLTIPSTVGVTYYVHDEPIAPGAHPITGDTVVEARPNNGYVFAPNVDDDWAFDYS